jgi:ribonuclease T1
LRFSPSFCTIRLLEFRENPCFSPDDRWRADQHASWDSLARSLWRCSSRAPCLPRVPDRGTVVLAELPREAQATEVLIRAGGPFASGKDGSVFGNRERLLPAEPRGYYREYTVMTPGARDRGARRIVCGGRQPTAPEACYYTGDHYASFRRIVQQAGGNERFLN